MNTLHPSHYFESAEQFVNMNPRKCSVAVLKRLTMDNGCSKELVDHVVNGVMADYIMDIIAPEEKQVTVTDQYGRESKDTSINLSPPEDLIHFLVGYRFSDLTTSHAEKLIEYLIGKSALTISEEGLLYRSKSLIKRQPVTLA